MFRFLLCVILAVHVEAFQWMNTSADDFQVVTCSGDVIHLTFNFSLNHDELVEAMKWTFAQAEGRADEDIAIYSNGHFVVMPAFSGRVQRLGEGGLSIDHTGVLESGNYSVEVTIELGGHTFHRYVRTALVLIADPPQAEGGSLHVQQTSQAVYDASSGQWRVQLTCGKLTSLGQPPVHVIWTAPDGQELPSTSGPDNGTFTLLLPNPPSGGNFTCSLPPPSQSPATHCPPSHSPLLGGASVNVDQVKAAFALLEAKQHQMQTDFEAIQTELKTELNEQKNKTNHLQAQLDAKTLDLENKTKALQALDAKITELETRCSTCTTNKVTTRISFQAQLTTSFTGSGRLQPFTVIRSEGQGFEPSTGQFVVPLNGTYFFIGSAATDRSSTYLYFDLMIDSTTVARTISQQYSSYDVAATVHAVLHLTVGQHVYLQGLSCSNCFYHNYYTYFSGFLVNPDV